MNKKKFKKIYDAISKQVSLAGINNNKELEELLSNSQLMLDELQYDLESTSFSLNQHSIKVKTLKDRIESMKNCENCGRNNLVVEQDDWPFQNCEFNKSCKYVKYMMGSESFTKSHWIPEGDK